ncbi:complement resistance protein TraT [Vibrio sp. S11_S32]|uniref:complement resistance protein TraT n=1 Tax=Vibrio sp. S11_S32 TaxID=2720225 RepID=UPI001681245D|nr:complement resistance protein TraT [Vibrio sp. S11_S32]MBD1576953.1 complement resistance protein TraT [Vibrio sp. S11_S32]
MKKNIIVIGVALGCVAISGCTAMKTEISKRNLVVKTKMSDTIFLDPVSPDEQTVYLQIRNTTDKQDLKIKPQITTLLTQKGYTVTNNYKQAHYLIQANILKIGKSDLNESKGFLAQGYGSAIAGGAIAASTMGSGTGAVGMGVLGMAAGFVADSMVEDTYYSMVTDLQISEHAAKGVQVTEHNQAKLHQGNSGAKMVTSTETTSWKRYQTRIVSTANQANLKFEDAEPTLEKGLAGAISGIL